MPHDAGRPRTRAFLADAVDLRVAARLATRRRELGIDAALLDLLLGLRAGTIARMEAGLSRIAARDIWLLSLALGVDVSWFFAEPSLVKTATEDLSSAPFGSHCRVEEARRFVALFNRIEDPAVRAVIAEMVRALAQGNHGEDAEPDVC